MLIDQQAMKFIRIMLQQSLKAFDHPKVTSTSYLTDTTVVMLMNVYFTSLTCLRQKKKHFEGSDDLLNLWWTVKQPGSKSVWKRDLCLKAKIYLHFYMNTYAKFHFQVGYLDLCNVI